MQRVGYTRGLSLSLRRSLFSLRELPKPGDIWGEWQLYMEDAPVEVEGETIEKEINVPGNSCLRAAGWKWR